VKLSLDGKVAIVTGGASGIGLAAGRKLAEAGARVVLADVQDGQAAAREIDGRYLRTDVRDPAAVERLVGSAVTEFGRLDVYFNNAGIECHGPLVGTDPEDHKRVMDVNVNGVFYGLKYALAAMLRNPGPSRGSIVNTASVAGLTGVPGLSSYNASKGAVVLLTRNAAVEVRAVRDPRQRDLSRHDPHADGHPIRARGRRRILSRRSRSACSPHRASGRSRRRRTAGGVPGQ
jgi:NAD(P)-dependent dehydrogenase (short-subunit alcohol dehydrogenase family)